MEWHRRTALAVCENGIGSISDQVEEGEFYRWSYNLFGGKWQLKNGTLLQKQKFTVEFYKREDDLSEAGNVGLKSKF